MPMMALADRHPNLNILLPVEVALGIVVAIVGCLDFCRLEAQ
jgi:hypothetical protein